MNDMPATVGSSRKKMMYVVLSAIVVVGIILIGLFAVKSSQTTKSEASGGLCPAQGYIDQDAGGACPLGTEPIAVTISSAASGSGPAGSSINIQCCKIVAGTTSNGSGSATTTTNNGDSLISSNTTSANSGTDTNTTNSDLAQATTSTTNNGDSTSTTSTTPNSDTTSTTSTTTNTTTTSTDTASTNTSLNACPADAELNVTISCLGCEENAR